MRAVRDPSPVDSLFAELEREPEQVVSSALLEEFDDISFLHYYDENGDGILHEIDYSIARVMRTPDHDKRVQNPRRPMSIVVDCRK